VYKKNWNADLLFASDITSPMRWTWSLTHTNSQ